MGASLRALHCLAWILVATDCNVIAVMDTQDLGGDMWSAVGTSPPSTFSMSVPKATVPGCIHTDWYNTLEPTKQNNPYYRFNDVGWRNIAENNWSYMRTFSTDTEILKRKEQWLVCEGLDTIANVSVNGKFLGSTKNMFLRHLFNVTGLLQPTFNQIVVSFQSAVHYANATSKNYNYSIPPECPPDVQHGFCHVNLIRKEQCSFSWDWGPGFATQGIWKPIYLLGLDEAVMLGVTASYDWDSQVLYVKVRFHSTGAKTDHDGWIDLYIDELLPISSSYNVSASSEDPVATVTQKITRESLKLWWPNGQGEQKLYNITVRYRTNQLKDHSLKTIWFGFRKVELVQEAINGSDGLSFYFKMNEKPIFAKGSNWIPADAFLNRLTKENYTNLLQSAKDVNMNMLRVWGGGIYERDDFYEIADRLGIMIWHDFMFACAMYPADSGFLQSVSKEINDTLWRLEYHPSIVIWAGNNENEAALGTDWYNTTAHFDRYKKDYVNLYVDTIAPLISSFDPNSRPYLTSSPTNGAETKTEGWVAKNPYDTHYGDTHYYNYKDDCLDWTKYPKTRFASEYGFQSWPSIEVLQPVSEPEDLSWTSNFSMHRNHHADGNQQMLNQIVMHFNLPDSKDGLEKFENQIYLSQIMQGLCYKSETEFYRRSRSEIVNGEGHTMGALYWQLNDIWQAPTWSSIEYGGKWKVVHYFAKKFFANVALSAYDDDTQLTVYSLSDSNSPIEPVTLVIEMHSWGGFDIIHTWENSIYITPQSSKMQYQQSTGILLHYGGCDHKELCYFVIYLKEIPDVDPTFFYPVPFKDIEGVQNARIEVLSVQPASGNSSVTEAFDITLTTSAPAFFVWLEAIGIRGRFSDNSFHLYTPNKTVTFYVWEKVTADQLKSSLKIKSLADVHTNPVLDQLRDKKVKRPKMGYVGVEADDEIQPTDVQEIYWLDDIVTQVTMGICGSIFLMMCAILVAYVVTRSGGQTSPQPKIISPGRNSRKGSTASLHSRKASVVSIGQYSRRGSSVAVFLGDQEELLSNDEDNKGGAFKLNLKSGYGHNAKNVEIRFYIT